MSTTLRWGVLGTGNIARQFAAGVATAHRSVLAAVGSRSEQSARAFAENYRVPTAYGSYDQLLADKSVEAVYISLPNSMHHQWTLRACAGKHVLCEKPFAVNSAQAQEMFEVADQTGRTLIEAFMYRAHPLTHAVLKAVRERRIGRLKLVRTSFCYRTTRIDGNIRFSAELAGGALMDIGCYCINLTRVLAGEDPVQVHASGTLHAGGVDELAAGTMRFANGVLGSFICGMTVQADNTAYICGDEGYIEVPVPWKPPVRQAAYIIAHSTPPKMDARGGSAGAPPPRQTYYIDAPAELYGMEADAFAAAALDGAEPFCTRQETLSVMRVLDEMRRQVGVAGASA